MSLRNEIFLFVFSFYRLRACEAWPRSGGFPFLGGDYNPMKVSEAKVQVDLAVHFPVQNRHSQELLDCTHSKAHHFEVEWGFFWRGALPWYGCSRLGGGGAWISGDTHNLQPQQWTTSSPVGWPCGAHAISHFPGQGERAGCCVHTQRARRGVLQYG